MMLPFGLGRDIFQGVAIAVLSTVCGKLLDWGIEEVKKRKQQEPAHIHCPTCGRTKG